MQKVHSHLLGFEKILLKPNKFELMDNKQNMPINEISAGKATI